MDILVNIAPCILERIRFRRRLSSTLHHISIRAPPSKNRTPLLTSIQILDKTHPFLIPTRPRAMRRIQPITVRDVLFIVLSRE